MTSSYPFIDTTAEVESTWKVIKESKHNAVDRLSAITFLLKDDVGQLELDTLEAQLLYVAFRELKDMKLLAGVQTKPDNKINEQFDRKVNELFDLLDVEIAYCDKYVKFSASTSDMPLSNQYNRGRLCRVQLYATQAFDYIIQWSVEHSEPYKQRLAALEKISDCLARFDIAQQDYIKTLKNPKALDSSKRKQKKTLSNTDTKLAKRRGDPPRLCTGSTLLKPD